MKGAINQYIIINEIEEIVRLEEEVKKIQKILKEKKENIKNFLEKKDIKKAKVGNYLVSITSSSSYTSIDTAKLKREEPKLYEELISKFGKQIVRNSSIKIK